MLAAVAKLRRRGAYQTEMASDFKMGAANFFYVVKVLILHDACTILSTSDTVMSGRLCPYFQPGTGTVYYYPDYQASKRDRHALLSLQQSCTAEGAPRF